MENSKKPGCLFIVLSWVSLIVGAFVIAGALIKSDDAFAYLNLQTIIGVIFTGVPVIFLRLVAKKEKSFWPWAIGWAMGIILVTIPAVYQDLLNPFIAILFAIAIIFVIAPAGLLLEHFPEETHNFFIRYFTM